MTLRTYLQDQILDRPGGDVRICRNNLMRPDSTFLDYFSSRDTDIFQDYFVPIDAFDRFRVEMGKLLRDNEVNCVNLTFRYLAPDRDSFLRYATQPMISAPLLVNHALSASAIERARNWTRRLIDLALDHGGSYYLAYQNYATSAQVRRAYPQFEAFLAEKRRLDPHERFSSHFYEHYSKT
jgi:decaprenylphospho-beta-D-ribofuranose 2-oxidase